MKVESTEGIHFNQVCDMQHTRDVNALLISQAQVQSQQDELKAQAANLMKQLKDKIKTIKKLEKKITKTLNENERGEEEGRQKEVNDLKKALEKARDEISQLKTTNVNAKFRALIEELLKQIVTLKATIALSEPKMPIPLTPESEAMIIRETRRLTSSLNKSNLNITTTELMNLCFSN
jgi:chromosome segregation ATPase